MKWLKIAAIATGIAGFAWSLYIKNLPAALWALGYTITWAGRAD